jgi:hypothetical protein
MQAVILASLGISVRQKRKASMRQALVCSSRDAAAAVLAVDNAPKARQPDKKNNWNKFKQFILAGGLARQHPNLGAAGALFSSALS